MQHRAFDWQQILAGVLVLLVPVADARAQETRSADPIAAVQTAELAGRVFEAGTGRALAGARVRLLEAHREEPTHADGRFLFRGLASGAHTVVVEHIGYATATVRIDLVADERRTLDVPLSVQAIRLGGLVVTGTLSRREGRDVLSPVSVVSGAELDRRLDGTVAGTLRGEPGLSVTTLGPATGRPVIRGLGGDRILVLEDGLRPGDMSSTSSDHAIAIEPLTAGQLEVVRGPMSLLYGSSALGGVVNVIRDEIPGSVPEHAHGTLLVQGASVNRGAAAGGSVTLGVGGWALRAEASGRTAGDVRTPAGPLVNTGARTLGGALAAARTGDWGHAGLAYRFYDNDYGIPGGFVGGHETGVDIAMRRHALRAEVELHRETHRLSRVSVYAGFVDYAHSELEQSGRVGTRFGQRLASVDAVARHGEQGAPAEGAFGVRGQFRDITTGGSLRTPSTWDAGFAVFAVEELAAGPLRVQLGARWDVARYAPRDTSARVFVEGRFVPVRTRTFASFSGSAGLLWAATDAVRVGASVSRAYRTPDFNELYSNGPHLAANSYDVGDPDLDPETGLGLDAFVRFERANGTIEVAAFHNRLADYVFPSSRGRAELGAQGERPRFQYTNEDVRLLGAEGSASWLVLPSLVLEATASWVRADFRSDRAPIPVITPTDTTFVPASTMPPLIPPLHGRAGIRWDRAPGFVGTDLRWAGRQDRLGDFEDPTGGFAVAGFSAGLRRPLGGRFHTLTLRVDNLFDTEHRDHLSRVKDIMPEPGRSISVVYRLAF